MTEKVYLVTFLTPTGRRKKDKRNGLYTRTGDTFYDMKWHPVFMLPTGKHDPKQLTIEEISITTHPQYFV